jgi:trimeric autotransporter adhesin
VDFGAIVIDMPDPNPYIIDTDSIIIRSGFFYLPNTYNPQSTNAMIAVGANGAITYADTLRNISTYGVGYLPDVFSTLNGQLSNLSTTIYNGGIQEPDFSAACLSLSTTTNNLSNWTADQISTLSIGISAVESLFYSTVYASSITSIQLVSTGNSLQTQIYANSTTTGGQISTTLAFMSTNPYGYAYSSAVNALSTYVYSTLTQGLSTTNENLNATASTQGIEISTLAGGFQSLSSLIGFSTLSSQITSTNQQLSSLSSYVNDLALSTANNTLLIENLSTSLSTTNASISSITSSITGGYATGNDISTISSALSSYATLANICTISSSLSSYATVANICTISAGLSGFPTGNDISTISSALSSYATLLALSNVSISQQQYVTLSALSSLVTSSFTTNNFAVRNQFAVSSFYVNGNSNTLGGTNPAFDQIGAFRIRTAQPQGFWLENTNNQPCEFVFKNTGSPFLYAFGSQQGSRGMFFWTGYGDALNADSSRNVAVALGSTNTAYKFYVNGNAYAPAFVASSISTNVLNVGILNATNIVGSVTGNNLSTLSSALSSYATAVSVSSLSASLSSYATIANICTISSALSSYTTTSLFSSLSGGIRTTYATGTSLSSLSASLSSYATVGNICTISSALSNYLRFSNLSSLTVSSLSGTGNTSFSTLSATYVYLNNPALSTLMYISGNINTIAGTNPVLDVVGAMRVKTQINQNFWLEASTGAEIVYKLTGVSGVMANGYQTLNSRGYYIYTGAGDAINADSSRNVAINVGSTNTAYKFYVNGSAYATSITAPVGTFSSVTASTLSVNGTANATSITAPVGTFSSVTASTLSVNGTANATSITAPIATFSSVTASTLSVNGTANATSITAPIATFSSLTTSTLSVNGTANATSITAPIATFSSLTTSTLTVNEAANATSITAPVGAFSSLTTSTLTSYTSGGFSTLTYSTLTGNIISTNILNTTGAVTIQGATTIFNNTIVSTGSLTVRRVTNPQLALTNGGSGPASATPVEFNVVNNGITTAIGSQADPRGTFIFVNGGDAVNIYHGNRQFNTSGSLTTAGTYMGFRKAAAAYRFLEAGTSNSFVRAKYTASGSTDTLVASTTAVMFDSINIPTVNAWMPGTYQLITAAGATLATTTAGTLIAAQNFTLTSNDWNFQSVIPFYMAFRGGLSMSFSTGVTAAPIRWYATYENFTQGSGARFMKGAEHFTEGRYVTTNMNMYSYSTGVESEKARIGDNISIRYFAQDYLASGIKVLSTPTQFNVFISPVVA